MDEYEKNLRNAVSDLALLAFEGGVGSMTQQSFDKATEIRTKAFEEAMNAMREHDRASTKSYSRYVSACPACGAEVTVIVGIGVRYAR